jgi:CO/xanthine dehydrogenase FAD-binding subunit
MHLPRFDYHAPSSLEEACQIIGDLREDARILAGGTDLLISMRRGLVSPKNVVTIGRIEELKAKDDCDGHLRLGAGLTVTELAQSDEVKESFSSVSAAASSLGSPLIRNLATIGGNLVTARPAADLPLPLIAHNASILLKKSLGERTVTLDSFFQGPGETAIEPNEILTEIMIEKPSPYAGCGYFKLGARRTLVISTVNVAAFLCLEEREGPIKSARVVMGAVAPTPMRSASAEKVLMGERPTEALFANAGEAAAADSKPIDDFRGSAEYRRAMVAVLVRRALKLAFREAQRKDHH